MNKKNKILVLGIYAILTLIFFLLVFLKIKCPSKLLFHIPCPFCGMTRAAEQLLQFNILETFRYNILLLPLVLYALLILIIDIYDLIYKKDYLKKVFNFSIKHFYIFIILIIISFIINIIRGI